MTAAASFPVPKREGRAIPRSDDRELQAQLVNAFNRISAHNERMRAALLDGRIDRIRDLAHLIAGETLTIGTLTYDDE
jgi:hypothetical protein